MQVYRPNWCDGFADFSLKDLSDAPEQWLGDVASYAPFLGVQGATLYDLSGYGTHGTLNGGATWTAGIRGSALSFNGTDGYVAMPTRSIATVITVSAWVYSANFAQDGMIVMKQPVNGEWELFFQSFPDNEAIAGLKWRGSSLFGIAAPAPENNRWHHIAARQVGTSGQLFTDGVQSATGTVGAIANGSGALRLGTFGGAGQYTFTGLIDDVRIYNRALSDTEIADIYADPFAKYRLRRRMWAVSFDAIDVSQFRRRPPR